MLSGKAHAEDEKKSVVAGFRAKLRLAMEHRGVPREKLAAAAGVAVSAVGDWLTRDRRPYADQAWALARSLDVPL